MIRTILPSITTAGAAYTTWRKTIDELRRLRISECALFLTGLHKEERLELYARLEKVAARQPLSIPFVHARSDMEAEEYQLLIRQFGTQSFNLHPVRELPLIAPLPGSLRKLIYIENTTGLRASDLKGFAGICTDISHIEDYKRQGRVEQFTVMAKLVRQFSVGVSHISAVTKAPYLFKNGTYTYAPHHAQGVTDFAYLRSYPKYFFGKYVAIELDNSLAEQIQIKDYIERVIWKQRERLRFNWTVEPAISTTISA